MKLVKSLLLGTAAGLAAVAGAQAADLPFRKAAPVDYVRVCDWTKDAGYFYIPGTDTCLRIGGEVRFEYAYVQPHTTFVPAAGLAGTKVIPNFGESGTTFRKLSQSSSGFFARGKIETDVRTQTAYGLLRAFVRFQGDTTGGNYNEGVTTGGTIAAGGTGSRNGQDGGGVTLDRAFIEFAGFTAGRRQSFYDFYADNYNYNGIATSDSSSTVLAYTATFGGGFSATISVEDARQGHSTSIGAVTDFAGVRPTAAAVVALPALAGNTLPVVTGAAQYGGEQFPDVIGLVRYDNDSWGAVQLSAAYHDINTISGTGPGTASKDGTGFAVSAGLYLKLPMIAAGDELWLQGQYQEGAVMYQEESGNLSNGYYGTSLGGFIHQDRDAVAIGNVGNGGYHLALAKGFSVLGAFQHYFTPQFHDVLYGSYEEIGYGAQVRNTDWSRGGIGDASQYKIGNQFIFTPVHNFDIGIDVMYTKLNQDIAHDLGVSNAVSKANFKTLHPGVSTDPDSFEVRLRLNRDF